MQIPTTREDHLVAWLAALAIVIHVMESTLPSPLPGIKPGLANVITVLVLCLYGWRVAVWVALLRVLVGSILVGSFLSPGFYLSLSGAICSLAVMGMATRLPILRLSPLGYSILASLAHMAGQFWTAYSLFIPHPAMFNLLPLLMTAALVFGTISGIITLYVIRHVTP